MTGPLDTSPWPDARQLLLLRAALLDGDAALDAWREFRRICPDLGDLDYPSYRVLPQLYRNLSGLDVGADAMAHLKGVYRHAWYANQRLLHRGASALRALRAEGLEPILLKGAAIVTLYHDDVALRPMDDVDILVAPAQASRAIEALKAVGFEPGEHRPLAQFMRIRHALALYDGQGNSIDVHWSALFPRSDDRALRAAAIPVTVRNVEALAASPTDQLVLAAAHGLGWSPAPMRWITDCLLLLGAAPGAIDWAALVERARSWRVELAVGGALRFLCREFRAPIPESAVSRLEVGAGHRDRVLHDLKVNRDPARPWWKLARQAAFRWDATRMLATAPALEYGHPTNPLAYLREEWGIDSRASTLAFAARKGATILTGGTRA